MKPPLIQGASHDFQTPPSALNPLYKYLKPEWVIWECAWGENNLTKALYNKGFKVYATDIKDNEEYDFLTFNVEEADCIITNPPYDLKQQFLERAYQLGKPFAFLLPLTTFETNKRQTLFKEFGVEVILFDKRINFTTPSGQGSGSWFATAWFTNWLNIGRQLTFEHYEEDK